MAQLCGSIVSIQHKCGPSKLCLEDGKCPITEVLQYTPSVALDAIPSQSKAGSTKKLLRENGNWLQVLTVNNANSLTIDTKVLDTELKSIHLSNMEHEDAITTLNLDSNFMVVIQGSWITVKAKVSATLTTLSWTELSEVMFLLGELRYIKDLRGIKS